MTHNAGHLRSLGISCSVRLVKMPVKERDFNGTTKPASRQRA